MPTLALLLWPFISLGLFAGFGFKRGVILSVVIGYLFLPSNFIIDLPVVPPYGKDTAVAVGLALGYLFFGAYRRAEVGELVTSDRLFSRLMKGLLFIYVLTPVFVYLTNQEGLSFGPRFLPGLSPWDVFSMIWGAVILLVPFFVGWRVLATDRDHLKLLQVLVGAGLIYSLLALFEVRMSPQLHTWVYGYFPHSFLQHMRGGGFRPVVFLNHGLSVGFFLLSVALASVALSRTKAPARRMMFLLATGWFFMVLLLSRNLGASLLALLFIPALLFLGTWLQVRISVVVAIVFLAYPAVRQADILPIDRFVSFVETISANRAKTFSVRLNNEQKLLERASERPIFGWGSYGRNRIYNERGRDVSITDGRWIIVLGTRGWVGYIALFGLITLPVLWLRRVRRRKSIPPVTTGLAVIMATNFIDLVPNSTLSPIGLLIAGALAGFVQFDSAAQPAETKTEPRFKKTMRYSRFSDPKSRSET